jgi:hypothetical protein
MKIIFSPSKSQHLSTQSLGRAISTIFFEKESRFITDILKNQSIKEIIKIYKVSKKKALEVASYYNDQNETKVPAISLFSGTSFGELNTASYTSIENEYIQNHLIILSALYGALRPFDGIMRYRLDMTNKIFNFESPHKNLYNFWIEKIQTQFNTKEVIINLASNEYAKMITSNNSLNIVTIHFLVQYQNNYISIAIHAKKQRGKMLHYLIKNRIIDPEKIYNYSSDGFIFDKQKSNTNTYFFIRRKL